MVVESRGHLAGLDGPRRGGPPAAVGTSETATARTPVNCAPLDPKMPLVVVGTRIEIRWPRAVRWLCPYLSTAEIGAGPLSICALSLRPQRPIFAFWAARADINMDTCARLADGMTDYTCSTGTT